MKYRIDEYIRRLEGCKLIKDAPMSEYTTFRIGGPADVMLCPCDRQELIRGIDCAKELGIPYYIMGNGSNLLVSDDGIEGIVIRISSDYSGIEFQGNRLRALAGTPMSVIAMESVRQGLMGLEWAGGIPGSAGGAAAMNAGAYGGELKQVLRRVECLTPQGIASFEPADSDMAYRYSRFCAPDMIVTALEMELQTDDGGAAERMREYSARRREHQPLSYPSAGSVFKRPQGNYAGALIEQAGLKGVNVGGAEVSTLHAGFIINRGGASCYDVMELIRIITDRVQDMCGIRLEREILRVGR